MKLAFTKRALAALPVPASGRVVYSDAGCAGLRLFVTAAGARTFYFSARIHGRAEQLRIGPWPAVSIDDARTRAKQLGGQVARGEDPAQERREARGELTIEQLFDAYMAQHVTVYRKATTASGYRSLYRAHLASLKHRRLSTLTRGEVQRLHAAIGAAAGTYTANRVIALLRALYERARSWGYIAPAAENPARGIERFREESRERFLQPDELPRFFAALAEEPDRDGAEAIALLLMTGARKSSVLAARWADLDLAAGLWRLPDSKTGAVVLPLAPQAVELLRARQTRSSGAPWVFPSPRSSEAHREGLRGPWERVIEKAKVPDLHLHDLRRSLGSWQAGLGVSLPIIGASLGHKTPAATAVYARLQLATVRESVARAVAAMLDAGTPSGDESER